MSDTLSQKEGGKFMVSLILLLRLCGSFEHLVGVRHSSYKMKTAKANKAQKEGGKLMVSLILLLRLCG